MDNIQMVLANRVDKVVKFAPLMQHVPLAYKDIFYKIHNA